MPAKKKRPRYHHGDLRRALLDAARIELHKVGVQELSLRGVARRAGVTHTAAYHHFDDKNALLRRIAQEGFEKLTEAMLKEMGDVVDAVDRLVAAGVGYLRFAADDPQALQLMFESGNGIHSDDAALEAAGARAFLTLLEATDAARSSRDMEGAPLPDAILQWSMVHGFATLSRDGRFGFASVDEGIAAGKAMLLRVSSSYFRSP